VERLLLSYDILRKTVYYCGIDAPRRRGYVRAALSSPAHIARSRATDGHHR